MMLLIISAAASFWERESRKPPAPPLPALFPVTVLLVNVIEPADEETTIPPISESAVLSVMISVVSQR